MMKNITHDISNYTFTASDQLFFDANIWLFIYGPQGNPVKSEMRLYSGAMSSALKAGSLLYIDVLILSEFINRFARLEHQVLVNSGRAPFNFKIFRSSRDFKLISPVIADNVRRILKHCERVGNGFETLDLITLLNEYEKGLSDFNDQVIASLCKSRGLSLVTHDVDFDNHGLTIITGNKRMLN